MFCTIQHIVEMERMAIKCNLAASYSTERYKSRFKSIGRLVWLTDRYILHRGSLLTQHSSSLLPKAKK